MMSAETTSHIINSDFVAQHIAGAADQLGRRGADGLLVFRDSNILAFCGVPLGPSDRLVCGLINRCGRVAVILPAFEAQVAKASASVDFIVTWKEDEDPYAVVATAAERLGLGSGTIVLDGHTWVEAWRRLHAALPRTKLVADNGIIESVRIKKSPQEVEAIHAACCDTGKVYPLAADCLRVGASEIDVGEEIARRIGRDGYSLEGQLIQGGETASVPHRPSGERVFQAGDAIVVDCVCARDGYHGDITRTFALGEPDDEIRRAYAVVREAQQAAIGFVRPGVTCEAVDSAARDIIDRAGLGSYFTHRLGHGVGLDGHEPPYLVQGNRRVLEPGMCMTVEPGVYVPGRFGIRIEDVVVVTESGCDILTDTVPTDVSEAFK